MADADLKIRVATEPKDPFKDVKESMRDLNDGVESVIDRFKGIAAAGAGVAAVGAAFNFVVNSTREMQDLTTQFIAFTGSAEAASKQMERLTAFASESPFSLAEVAEANRTLLAFGSSAQQSVEQLRQIGEISAATGKSMSELAAVFGKIQQNGKLTGETFQQLIERGVNLGPEIAKSMGVASTSISDLISKSKISSDEVSKALAALTSEGGKYFGSTERMAGTLTGSMNQLKDSVAILASEVGGRLAPSLTETGNAFSELIGGITEYLAREREIGNSPAEQKIRSLNNEIERTSTVFQNMIDISNMESGFGKIAASFPFGGSEGVERRIDSLKTKIQELVAERNKLIDAKQADAAAAALEESAAAEQEARDKAAEKQRAKVLEAQAKQLEDEAKAAEERKKKIADAENQVSQLLIQETTARFATQDAIAEAARQRQAEADQKAVAAKLLAEQEAATGTQIIRSNAEIAEEVRRAEAAEKLRVSTLEAVTARESEVTTARVQAEAARAELLGQYEQAEAMRQQDLQRKLTETQKKGEADRLAAIRKAQKEEFDIELQTANAKKQFDEQTYAQRLATAQAGLNALSGLMKSKNREAFEIGKAAAIAQALVSIPATAIEAYKSLAGVPLVGPALGAAAAAAAVFAGYEQVKNIQNTRLAMAEGGMVPGQGNRDTVPALLTPGEVVVPKKNFGDLQDAFVRGAVADDQVMLLQAGNNIQMRILDTLTYGTINEKLTLIVAGLDNVKSAISNLPVGGSGNSTPITVPEVQVAIEEIDRNVPVSSRQRKQETLQTKSRVDDMR